MNVRHWGLGLSLACLASTASAAQGLVLPAAETLWPQWQARVTLMTAGGGAP